MPCMCWYEPKDEHKKHFKSLCQSVVDFIKEQEKIGDPLGISVKNAQELIAHLYNPDICIKGKNNGNT